MRFKRPIIIILIVIISGILSFYFYARLRYERESPKALTIEQYRAYLDTSLFIDNPRVDSVLKRIIYTTSWYKRYRLTNHKDSLRIYLKRAEGEAIEILSKNRRDSSK